MFLAHLEPPALREILAGCRKTPIFHHSREDGIPKKVEKPGFLLR